MSKISRQAGVARVSLYRTLSGQQDPRFRTIARVLRAPGLQLRVERMDGAPLSRSGGMLAWCPAALSGAALTLQRSSPEPRTQSNVVTIKTKVKGVHG
jgi:hypothetical protein